MSIKTIDQLCARDLGKRVRVATSLEVVEGALGHVRQYGRKESRFALFSRHDMYEIRVGSISLAGMSAKVEVEFLPGPPSPNPYSTAQTEQED